jgi:hypothetical protein
MDLKTWPHHKHKVCGDTGTHAHIDIDTATGASATCLPSRVEVSVPIRGRGTLCQCFGRTYCLHLQGVFSWLFNEAFTIIYHTVSSGTLKRIWKRPWSHFSYHALHVTRESSTSHIKCGHLATWIHSITEHLDRSSGFLHSYSPTQFVYALLKSRTHATRLRQSIVLDLISLTMSGEAQHPQPTSRALPRRDRPSCTPVQCGSLVRHEDSKQIPWKCDTV